MENGQLIKILVYGEWTIGKDTGIWRKDNWIGYWYMENEQLNRILVYGEWTIGKDTGIYIVYPCTCSIQVTSYICNIRTTITNHITNMITVTRSRSRIISHALTSSRWSRVITTATCVPCCYTRSIWKNITRKEEFVEWVINKYKYIL